MRFTNKTALVTGGNSGIGFVTVKLLIAEGARVAITGRDRTKLDNAAAELGENAVAIQTDLDDPAAVETMAKSVSDAFGSLNILFVNAGISGRTPLGNTTAAAFETILRTNVTAVFMTVQAVLPLMHEGASIVLNGSVMRQLGSAGSAAYSASKAGVTGMGKVFASELVARGIRVNTVIPGGTHTYDWLPASGLPSAVLELANLYVAFARDRFSGTHDAPDFDDAVWLHRFFDMMETSSRDGRYIEVA